MTHYATNSTDSMKAVSVQEMHEQLAELLHESIRCVDVRNALIQQMIVVAGSLQIGKLSYPLSEKKRIVLIAAGKAAVPMCSVTADLLRPALRADQILTGIAVGPESQTTLPIGVEYFPGSHPYPSQDSRNAADAACALLQSLGEHDLVLFLMSGGASSMLEAPINPTISIEEVAEFYSSLVSSGLPITRMNALRKHFSAVKGGRLAALAAPAEQCTLIISDVPSEALDMVGSGPSLPDTSTVADCMAILRDSSLKDTLSPKVLEHFLAQPLQETPKKGDVSFSKSNTLCLLSNESILDQLNRLAQGMGYHVEVDISCDDWDYREAADYLIAKLSSLRKIHEKICVISGGEVSVKLPDSIGIGGRNQHFVLYTATKLANTEPYIAMLSAGSDGVDGNSPAAGALADTYTLLRSERLGLSASEALAEFDSYKFFHALGDSITTGPTGNNVRDVRIFLSA
jgi:hydroxypyruvate reductase